MRVPRCHVMCPRYFFVNFNLFDWWIGWLVGLVVGEVSLDELFCWLVVGLV